MSDIKMTITGGASLKAKLAALGDAAASQALARSLSAAALPIQNEAKEKAPYRSGTLSRGITSAVAESSATRARVVISTSNIPYARIQEFGGTIRAKGGGLLTFKGKDGRWRRMKQVKIPARPYLRPAFDTQKGAAVDTFTSALRALIAAAIQ